MDAFLSSCEAVAEREFSRLLARLHGNIDAALCDLADKADDPQVYADFIEAKTHFRGQRKALEAAFLKNLLESAAALGQGRRGGSELADAAHGFTLMGESELEESLAISNLISKAESRYQKELDVLCRYAAESAGCDVVSRRDVPFGPHAICHAFRIALNTVSRLDLAAKLVTYKAFDRQVMDQLGEVYGQCVRGSDEAGWAGIGEPIDSGPTGPVRQSGGVTAAGDYPRRTSLHPQPPGADFDTLAALLSKSRPRPRIDPGEPMVDTCDLVGALDTIPLPSGRAPDAGESARPRLEDQLTLHNANAAARHVGGQLRPMDADTLDLVFLIFEAMVRADEFAEPLKTLIVRLQIPVLKVVLQDKTFFSDSQHPVRRLFDELAGMALGWGDDGDRSPDGVYMRVQRVVEDVINRVGRERDAFAVIGRAVAKRLERERREIRVREAKVRHELETGNRRSSARRVVLQTIEERVKRHRRALPATVHALLYEGWLDVMLAVYARGGPESDEWRRAVKTIDRLLWSVRPKRDFEQKRNLLRRIPKLHRTLEESLAQVSDDHGRTARWLDELQSLHIAALRGLELAAAGSEVPGESGHGEMPLSDELTQLSIEGDIFTLESGSLARANLVANLHLDTWIEFVEPMRRVRYKLVWRDARSGTYVFVDRLGNKALETSAANLNQLLRDKDAKIIGMGDVSVVQRAFEAVQERLKRRSNRSGVY